MKLTEDDPRLYGIIIEDEVARAALNMGRDAYADAKKSGQIPTVAAGKRRKVLGRPFREMIGLPDRQPVAALAA